MTDRTITLPLRQGLIPLQPQPRNGRPFQLHGANPKDWFNERLHYPPGPMLFSWRCPFGENGEPVYIDGVWFWRPKG